MSKDSIKRLKQISTEIRTLEKEKEKLIDKILDSVFLTPKLWSDKFIDKQKLFNECLATTYVHIAFQGGGSDYFSWTPKEKQIEDFQKFKDNFLKTEEKYFLCESTKIFFQYQYSGHNACVRRKEQFTEKFIENDSLIYKYSWTNYDGFGHQCGSGHQSFKVNLKNLKISGYNDSKKRYDAGFQISKFL